MLPRKNRLVHKRDFEEVHRLGNFFSFGEIFLKVKKNNKEETRVGFSVGLKFSSRATERNRVKRQLREIIRRNLKKIKKGSDLVIYIKKNGKKEFSSVDLEKDLKAALKKTKLI
jgi:ribonuclease P protein component